MVGMGRGHKCYNSCSQPVDRDPTVVKYQILLMSDIYITLCNCSNITIMK